MEKSEEITCKIELADIGIIINSAVQEAVKKNENWSTVSSVPNSDFMKTEKLNSFKNSISLESDSVKAENFDKCDNNFQCSIVNKIKEHKCLKCDRIFTSLKGLRKHEREFCVVKKSKEYRCDKCNKTFSDQNDLKRHLVYHKLFCNHCSYFTYSSIIIDRYSNKTIGEQYKCDNCDFSTECLKRLRVHESDEHLDENSKKCNICDYSTNKDAKLYKHMQVHCTEKRHKCKLCDYSSARKDRLQTHVNYKHHQIKSFVCDQCGRSFNRVENLKEHASIFHMPPIHKCDRCDYATGCKKYLGRHKRKVHGDKIVAKCDM